MLNWFNVYQTTTDLLLVRSNQHHCTFWWHSLDPVYCVSSFARFYRSVVDQNLGYKHRSRRTISDPQQAGASLSQFAPFEIAQIQWALIFVELGAYTVTDRYDVHKSKYRLRNSGNGRARAIQWQWQKTLQFKFWRWQMDITARKMQENILK